jgi:hypothetical protein
MAGGVAQFAIDFGSSYFDGAFKGQKQNRSSGEGWCSHPSTMHIHVPFLRAL